MQAHPVGTVIFIRRSSETGAVGLLGRTFGVEALWPHRLVRCEINLNAQSIRFHALAVVGRITSRSCTKRPTAFPKDASSSDREVMAPPVDSCFVRPRGAGTWPIGVRAVAGQERMQVQQQKRRIVAGPPSGPPHRSAAETVL